SPCPTAWPPCSCASSSTAPAPSSPATPITTPEPSGRSRSWTGGVRPAGGDRRKAVAGARGGAAVGSRSRPTEATRRAAPRGRSSCNGRRLVDDEHDVLLELLFPEVCAGCGVLLRRGRRSFCRGC